MMFVLYTLHVLICFFLIAVVLLQQGKGADLSVFGGGGTQTAFGARGAATVLHKLSVGSFIAFIVTTLAIGVLQGDRSSSLIENLPEQTAEEAAADATDEAGDAEAADEAGALDPGDTDEAGALDPGGDDAADAAAGDATPSDQAADDGSGEAPADDATASSDEPAADETGDGAGS